MKRRTMRLIQSTLHLDRVMAYAVRELPPEGRVRVFEYEYVEAVRITLTSHVVSCDNHKP